MSEYQVRPVTADDIAQLRPALLRSADPTSDLPWIDNERAGTLHVGGYRDEHLVGFATITRQRLPGEDEPNAWRVVGIGVEHGHRGYGLGGRLLHRCLDHAASRGARLVWCRVPAGAYGFFRHLNFRRVGEPFEAAGAGPHYVMAARFVSRIAGRSSDE